MLDIRPATPVDAAGIARIHVKVWQSTYRGILPAGVLDEISIENREALWTDILTAYTATHPVLVAEAFGEGICGFGNAGPLRGEQISAYTGEFKTLYLLPAYQRRGIGRALLCRLAQLLLDRGHGSGLAWVLAANPACGFYEAMGGEIYGQREEQSEEGEIIADIAYGWPDLALLAGKAAP